MKTIQKSIRGTLQRCGTPNTGFIITCKTPDGQHMESTDINSWLKEADGERVEIVVRRVTD